MSNNIKLFVFDWGRTLYDPDTEGLFPETIELLELLSQKYCLAIVALATAGDEKIKERLKIIEESGLNRYFKSILFDQHDKDKLYRETLKTLNIKPEETIIVDDRVLRGIKWGNENGAQTIWFQNGKFKNELPDNETGTPSYVIHNLSEIKSVITADTN